jgi:hypothetical protein
LSSSPGADPDHAASFAIDDGDWDEATWKEACAVVDQVEREKGYRNDEHNSAIKFLHPESGFLTPVKVANSTVDTSQLYGSTTTADHLIVERRRIIR